MQESETSAPLLVADIGATHSRFAVWMKGRLHAETTYPTASAGRGAAGGSELVARFIAAYAGLAGARSLIRGAALAVAGPVQDGIATLTNSEVCFDSALIAQQTGVRVRLVNDFAAVAAAVPFLRAEQLHPIGPLAFDGSGIQTTPTRRRRHAVIGPGSGLGMAALIPRRDEWLVLSSEGGHSDLPATDALEAEIVIALREGAAGAGLRDSAASGPLPDSAASVTWESCLSGPGIVALYGAVCSVWGCAVEHERAESITAGAEAGDPVCAQTVEMFWGILGNAAGNLALLTCATGGVFVAGGIVPRILDQFDARHFRRRFEQRGVLRRMVQDIPTAVIVEPMVGLYGAARVFDSDVDVLE